MKKRKEIKEYDSIVVSVVDGINECSIFSDATKRKIINIDVAIKLLNKAKSKGNTHIEIEVSGIDDGVYDYYGSPINCCSDVDINPLVFRYQTKTEELKEKSKEATKKVVDAERHTFLKLQEDKIKQEQKEQREKETYLKLKKKFEI